MDPVANENLVEDIIEEISPVQAEDAYSNVSEHDESELYSSDNEGGYIHVDDLGNSVERVVDVLGGIFVTSEGSTLADVLARISESLEKQTALIEAHNEILEKQSKILYKLSKILETK